MFASSSNGRTADSDSVNLGSNPGEAANKKTTIELVVFLLAEKHLLMSEQSDSLWSEFYKSLWPKWS